MKSAHWQAHTVKRNCNLDLSNHTRFLFSTFFCAISCPFRAVPQVVLRCVLYSGNLSFLYLPECILVLWIITATAGAQKFSFDFQVETNCG